MPGAKRSKQQRERLYARIRLGLLEGGTVTEVSRSAGVSRALVYWVARKNAPPRNERAVERRERWRRQRAAGWSVRRMAAASGVTMRAVQYALKRAREEDEKP